MQLSMYQTLTESFLRNYIVYIPHPTNGGLLKNINQLFSDQVIFPKTYFLRNVHIDQVEIFARFSTS
jgi:hypothetical protein